MDVPVRIAELCACVPLSKSECILTGGARERKLQGSMRLFLPIACRAKLHLHRAEAEHCDNRNNSPQHSINGDIRGTFKHNVQKLSCDS